MPPDVPSSRPPRQVSSPAAFAASSAPVLHEIGWRHGTDKWDDTHTFLGESYLDIYERYLEPVRFDPVTVLELGVKGGGSLRMWKEYFPHGAIHGVDLNPRCRDEAEERVTIHTLSQDDEEGLTALAEAVGGFDLVIDDASHVNSLTAASFRILWPHVTVGGYYVIEDLGMSWVDYALLPDQDTFMDGELKMNVDRGVSPHQGRSTLDAVFRRILFEMDSHVGDVRLLHFWSGTAILQKGDPTVRRHRDAVPTPHVEVPDLLPSDRHRALLRRLHDAPAGGGEIWHEIWQDVDEAVRSVAGLARRELEVEHFVVDGVAAHLTVDRDDGSSHTSLLGAPGPGRRRVEFVCAFSPDPDPDPDTDSDPDPAARTRLRLYDTVDRGGSRSAVLSATTVDLLDGTVVFFPVGAPHEVLHPAPPRAGVLRGTLRGWLTGESARRPAGAPGTGP